MHTNIHTTTTLPATQVTRVHFRPAVVVAHFQLHFQVLRRGKGNADTKHRSAIIVVEGDPFGHFTTKHRQQQPTPSTVHRVREFVLGLVKRLLPSSSRFKDLNGVESINKNEKEKNQWSENCFKLSPKYFVKTNISFRKRIRSKKISFKQGRSCQ